MCFRLRLPDLSLSPDDRSQEIVLLPLFFFLRLFWSRLRLNALLVRESGAADKRASERERETWVYLVAAVSSSNTRDRAPGLSCTLMLLLLL